MTKTPRPDFLGDIIAVLKKRQAERDANPMPEEYINAHAVVPASYAEELDGELRNVIKLLEEMAWPDDGVEPLVPAGAYWDACEQRDEAVKQVMILREVLAPAKLMVAGVESATKDGKLLGRIVEALNSSREIVRKVRL